MNAGPFSKILLVKITKTIIGVQALFDSWNKKSTILSLIVKKERIYETGASVSRLKNAEGMEKSEILSELNFIIYCLENIAEEESVKIKNIF